MQSIVRGYRLCICLSESGLQARRRFRDFTARITGLMTGCWEKLREYSRQSDIMAVWGSYRV